nr:hypothetical protein FVER53263_20157 [Fusarium verticillioides]
MAVAQTHSSPNTGSLRNHYREVHEQKLEIRQAGPNKRHLQNDLIRWYYLFAGRISHNWSPRKAKHRGFSPELEARPSIQSLLPTGPPTPLYGPGARYDSATDFEGFPDDNAGHESAAAAAAKYAAPLSTEDRGETLPSALRAARRGKQKATSILIENPD